MNIKRFIDQNNKLIKQIVIIIIFGFFIIKMLNIYYEEEEIRKQNEAKEIAINNQNNTEQDIDEDDYKTESDSIELTMASFVNYCNKREIKNAYDMLTEECKEAMFPTVEDFEKIYIKNVYNIEREYKLTKWSTDGNAYTYYVNLYANLLATANLDDQIQEYYTFVQDSNGKYKININNYINGEDKDIKSTQNWITVEIQHVDIYEEYEEIEFTVTNNSSKTICLTGNKYNKNIYLQNKNEITYSSFNTEFDYEEIIMQPNAVQSFKVPFNKSYNVSNKAIYLVFSDIILDYEDYLSSEDKANYGNRTSLKIKYNN